MNRWLVGILALSLIWPWAAIALDLQGLYAVSYTHLTLPTKA